MTGLEDKDYLRHRNLLDRAHKAAIDAGVENDDIYLAESAQLELQFVASYEIAKAGANLVFQWRASRNPHYMDLATMLCVEANVTPPPALLKGMGEAASERFNGETKGTADKIKKESEKWQTYTLMMNLIYHGLSLPKAASKAARWMKDQGSTNYRYVSSLEKQYTAEVRKTDIEKQHFESWDKWQDKTTQQTWLEIIQRLPDAPEWQQGARR